MIFIDMGFSLMPASRKAIIFYLMNTKKYCKDCVSNEDNSFYSGGESTIADNAIIKIWAGYSGINIPIYTGIIKYVSPIASQDNVIIRSTGYIGIMKEHRVDGSQGTNTTIKAIAESFATVGSVSNITGGQIARTVLDRNSLEPQTMLTALERLCVSIYHRAWTDENGVLYIEDCDYTNDVSWTYNDDNVLDIYPLSASELLNYVDVEYREGFFAQYKDTASIGLYGEKRRRIRALFLNYEEISSYVTGLTLEELDEDLEGFKFTSSAAAGNIDCIAIRMNQSNGSGNMAIKVYSDDGGTPGNPDAVIETSEIVQAGDLIDDASGFAWQYFKFTTPVSISPATIYWGIIDTSSVTGTINVRRSRVTASDLHVYGSWTTENDKQMLHIVRSSVMAQKTAEDNVRRTSKERIGIVASGTPHLQKMDKVLVDVTKPFAFMGRYVIIGRRHTLSRDGFVTIDWLEKTT